MAGGQDAAGRGCAGASGVVCCFWGEKAWLGRVARPAVRMRVLVSGAGVCWAASFLRNPWECLMVRRRAPSAGEAGGVVQDRA